MSNLKIVFIPRWLDRVAKEVGLTDAQLVRLEDLCGILSKRDVELYQMANFDVAAIVSRITGMAVQQASRILQDYRGCIPILPLEKRAAYGAVDTDTLIYGATATAMGEGEGVQYGLCACLGDQDTVLLRVDLMGSDNASPVAKAEGFVTSLTSVVHGVLSFEDFVRTGAFKSYVGNLQINPIH